jgi:formiminotetrahydrofolate cyclodeaminase
MTDSEPNGASDAAARGVVVWAADGLDSAGAGVLLELVAVTVPVDVDAASSLVLELVATTEAAVHVDVVEVCSAAALLSTVALDSAGAGVLLELKLVAVTVPTEAALDDEGSSASRNLLLLAAVTLDSAGAGVLLELVAVTVPVDVDAASSLVLELVATTEAAVDVDVVEVCSAAALLATVALDSAGAGVLLELKALGDVALVVSKIAEELVDDGAGVQVVGAAVLVWVALVVDVWKMVVLLLLATAVDSLDAESG